MVYPDQKYIDALLSNDPVVLQELYTRFFERIKKMVLDNNGTPGDAADVMQEALLAICYRARNHRLTITHSFEAFFYTVCHNQWMKELGKRKTAAATIAIHHRNNTLEEEEAAKVLEDYLQHQQRRMLILEKLDELNPGCRQLLMLCWSGKTMQEVAEQLGVTYAYVRKKKCGCIMRLIKLVRASGDYEGLK